MEYFTTGKLGMRVYINRSEGKYYVKACGQFVEFNPMPQNKDYPPLRKPRK